MEQWTILEKQNQEKQAFIKSKSMNMEEDIHMVLHQGMEDNLQVNED